MPDGGAREPYFFRDANTASPKETQRSVQIPFYTLSRSTLTKGMRSSQTMYCRFGIQVFKKSEVLEARAFDRSASFFLNHTNPVSPLLVVSNLD